MNWESLFFFFFSSLAPFSPTLHLTQHTSLLSDAHFAFTMAQYTLTDPKDLVVVVTGTSTGFGAGIVSDLYELGGYTIYATCTTSEGVKVYQDRNSSRLRPVKVDVTKKEDINQLRAQIEAECPQGLYCVVNNAGTLIAIFRDKAFSFNSP
jgi:hypothetical protein